MAAGRRTADAFLAALSSHQVDPCLRDRSGRTLLHRCLHWRGRTDVLDAVLDAWLASPHGTAMIDAAPWHRPYETPLYMAAQAGHPHVVQRLLAAGARVDPHPDEMDCPLNVASENWHVDVVDLLLKAGARAPAHLMHPFKRALFRHHHFPHRAKHPDVLLATLERWLATGIDLHELDDGIPPYTFLMGLAIGHPVAVLERFLRAGLDPQQRLFDDCTLLMEAVNPTFPYDAQASVHAMEAVPILLAHGVPLHAIDRHGNTALALAVQHGRTEMLPVLLEAGADVHFNPGGNGHHHFLRTAVHHSDVALLRHLLEAGADLDAIDDHGNTALMRAAMLGRTEHARLLLEAGASMTIRNYGGDTILWLATHTDVEDMIHLLAAAGAPLNETRPLNSKDAFAGETPLFMAVRDGHANTVAALIEAGASVNVRNAKGQTPMDVAAQTIFTSDPILVLLARADLNQVVVHADPSQPTLSRPRL